MSAISAKAGSLSVMIRLYKGAVTRWARANGYPDFAWQRGYCDPVSAGRTATSSAIMRILIASDVTSPSIRLNGRSIRTIPRIEGIANSHESPALACHSSVENAD
jgi:hypothetical protein